MNLVIMDLLEILCTKPITETSQKQNSNEYGDLKIHKELLKNQISNLADLLVEHVMLDQHFIDFQWASSNSIDYEENFDGEVDAMKLYIERFQF